MSARLRQLLSTEAIVRWASVAFAVAAAIAGMSTHLFATMAVLLIAGASWVLALSTFNVAVQLSAPRWVVARALSLYQMAAFGGMAAGSWLWGVIAEGEGVNVSLLSAALVTADLRGKRAMDSARAGGGAQSRSAAHVERTRDGRAGGAAHRAGRHHDRVVIGEEDIVEFLAAMAERRRIRRRDGARNWMLLRDLANPQIWIERYTTPTWLDYMRHNSRLTQDDAIVPERLRALHRGPDKPIVRRMIERQPGALAAAVDSAAHDLAEPLTDPTRAS